MFEYYWAVMPFGFLFVVFRFWYEDFGNRKRGLYIEIPPDEEILWFEKRASGRSSKSFRTKVGGASNCLGVYLTSEALLIQPSSFFRVLAPRFDLIQKIPIESIVSVESSKNRIGSYIEIEFRDSSGELRVFCLTLRNQRAFLDRLSGIRN